MSSALDRLEAIEKERALLQERFCRLAAEAHVPRSSTDARTPSPLTQCAPDCPTCMQEAEIARRWLELGDVSRDALVENAEDVYRKRDDHRRRSRRSRSRPPTLQMRGLNALLEEFPEITASQCIDILEGEPRTYDDDDVELYLISKDVLIRDLASDDVATIRNKNLKGYLRRAGST